MIRTCQRWANSVLWLISLLMLTMTGSAYAQSQTFKQEQLDQLLAPIALYPDPLLSQILMASTYPANISQAVQWSRDHPKEQGDAAVKAVANEPWDPSVKSLVAFPQVLAMMGEKPDWVQELGDAFLAQPSEVMNSVQKLRQAAHKTGSLKTTSQQKVVEQPASSSQPSTIIIQPANPQVIYVPTYNPTVVYGAWWWPAYPPVYLPPPPGYAFASGVAAGIGFSVGVAATYALWSNCDWYHHDVHIDVNRYNNININNHISSNQRFTNWQHNPSFRGGVPYRDQATRQRFNQPLHGGQNYRGFDSNTVNQRRQNAQNVLNRQGMNPAQDRQRLPAMQNRINQGAAAANRNLPEHMPNRPSGNNAHPNWQQHDHALGGNAGGEPNWRQQANRGNASRQMMQGRPQPAFNRPHPGGGGGFRRR